MSITSEDFQPIYARFSAPLFRYIYRITKSEALAEEVLHDVFFAYIEGRYEAQTGVDLKSWLYMVARNKSLNCLRHRSFEVSSPGVLESVLDSKNMELELIEKKAFQTLKVAETKMPTELQETWHLRKQGLGHAEIAQALSIPVGTVKSRMHRMVEILRREIDPNDT